MATMPTPASEPMVHESSEDGLVFVCRRSARACGYSCSSLNTDHVRAMLKAHIDQYGRGREVRRLEILQHYNADDVLSQRAYLGVWFKGAL